MAVGVIVDQPFAQPQHAIKAEIALEAHLQIGARKLALGQNVMGVKAFGAILDKKASFQPLPIFPKMWDEDDPSATILMTQSAPLMVPINPNNTFRARVVA